MANLTLTQLPCISLTLLFTTLFLHPTILSATVLDLVAHFGARPNGAADAAPAFLSAWEAACRSHIPATIHVRKGRYLVRPVVFSGSGDACKNPNITFRVEGTLVGPPDYRVLGNADSWISFHEVDGVTLTGGGFLDAKGPRLWACKASSSSACPDGATSLTFWGSRNIAIKGITSLNSQMFHISVNQCEDVHIEGVSVIAPGDSPNTDGIHVQLSERVTIFNTSIKTGDDCISIGPGTTTMLIERVACGPGHGISIGSLAKEKDEEGVRNIMVKSVVFTGTTNGLRIKSWARPSDGFVQDIFYQNVVMRRVQNPIIIDQDYCPGNINCPNKVSGIKITNVTYSDIRGTSATEVAVLLECSKSDPCTRIKLQNVNLTYLGKPALADCENIAGDTVGVVRPKGCF